MKKDENKKLLEFYKQFYKENEPVIIVAILFLAVLPICLYIIACTPSSIGFMNPEDARVWLTYYGAIAGGGMTLSGVAWTISNQRKEKKKDIAIQYKPIIVFKRFESNEHRQEKIIQISENDNFFSLNIFLFNHGRGEASNIKLYIMDILGCYDELNNHSMIVTGGHILSNLKIPVKFINCETKKKLPLKIMCTYQGLYDKTYYSYVTINLEHRSDYANGDAEYSLNKLSDFRFDDEIHKMTI